MIIPLNADRLFRSCAPPQSDLDLTRAEAARAGVQPVTVPHTWLT